MPIPIVMRRTACSLVALSLIVVVAAPASATSVATAVNPVSGLSATPSPFYPLVHDGYRDDTRIGFSLANGTDDTVAHVFADDVYGRCCGAEVRTAPLGALPFGAHAWVWDGAAGDGSALPRGTYFVKIEAVGAGPVSTMSKAQKAEIARGVIRKTATRLKHGSAYARVGDERATARGGQCLISRSAASHTAHVLCANAEVAIYWRWGLKPGQRIRSVSFGIDGGYYGCHKTLRHTPTQSILHVHAPPTSECAIASARIRYSYPVHV